MSNVVHLKPCTNVPQMLRDIADQYEAGEYLEDDCTMVIGEDIFHFGTFDDGEAAMRAVWNMTYAIHKLMGQVT